MTRVEAEAESPGTVDVQLAWSWDLINWTRPARRTPFFALGPKGSFDSKMIYTARAPVVMDDKLYFYYGGFDTRHNARAYNGAIGLATLRLDGFCSMHSGPAGGWLITRREKLPAPQIAINGATAPGGSIRAEILNLDGKVVAGFSVQDCVPFTGDSVRHTLRWRTEEFPAGVRDRVKQIRFYLTNADLYSYLPLS